MEIRLQLIIIACIVNFGLTPVEPQDQTENQVMTNKVEDGSEIQSNFRDLFDSIVDNNSRLSETYRQILKLEVAKERHAFDAIKDQLRNAQSRSFNKKRNVYKKSDTNAENGVPIKREIHDSSTWKLVDSLTPKSLERICDEVLQQIRLEDPTQAEREFNYVPVHQTALQSGRVARNAPVLPYNPYREKKVTAIFCIYMEIVFYLTRANATHVHRVDRNEDGSFTFRDQFYSIKSQKIKIQDRAKNCHGKSREVIFLSLDTHSQLFIHSNCISTYHVNIT